MLVYWNILGDFWIRSSINKTRIRIVEPLIAQILIRIFQKPLIAQILIRIFQKSLIVQILIRIFQEPLIAQILIQPYFKFKIQNPTGKYN